MTWEKFERATKFLAGIFWATWELTVRDQPDPSRLVFIATILGISEVVRAKSKANDE